MSIASIGWQSRARSWQDEFTRRWEMASPEARTRVQVALLVGSILVAFHYSLQTLMQDLTMDTPLAYAGLVPALALGLAAILRTPKSPEPAIHDRQLDYIVGLPLLAGSVAMNIIVPQHITDLYWLWRLDLLSLPIFVAGAIAIIFGVRVLWRQKLTIGYLLLAWPLPYSVVLLRILNGFTNLTISALTLAVRVIPVAKPVGGTQGSIFQVNYHGHSFPMSVVSACSGVNSVVGFVLVGALFAVIVRGPRLRKGLWLVGGMILLWLVNLARLLFIFLAGRLWGENVAVNVLHPFVGLVTFSAGVILMILVLKPLGLTVGWSSPALPSQSKPGSPAVPRIYAAAGLLAVTALILGISNSNLKTYNLVANAAGEPTLSSYSLDPAAPPGWTAQFNTTYTWATPYFGKSSTWYRFLYTDGPGDGGLSSPLPITADVINTTNLNSFTAYGVQACYRFHGYTLRDVANVKLGLGIKGQALSYTTSSHGNWTLVYWIWPVRSNGATHFERIILYIQDVGSGVRTPGPVLGISSLQGALDPRNRFDQSLIDDRAFLVQFARDVVTAQRSVAAGTQLPQLARHVYEQQRGSGLKAGEAAHSPRALIRYEHLLERTNAGGTTPTKRK